MVRYHTNNNISIVLMNAMCNMNQFVIVVPIQDEISVIFTSYCMQYMLMKFGSFHLIILNDVTPF